MLYFKEFVERHNAVLDHLYNSVMGEQGHSSELLNKIIENDIWERISPSIAYALYNSTHRPEIHGIELFCPPKASTTEHKNHLEQFVKHLTNHTSATIRKQQLERVMRIVR